MNLKNDIEKTKETLKECEFSSILFKSNTEENDFSGFNAQDENEDG